MNDIETGPELKKGGGLRGPALHTLTPSAFHAVRCEPADGGLPRHLGLTGELAVSPSLSPWQSVRAVTPRL